MTKSLSCTNDTGRGHGCPCGRSHAPHGARRQSRRAVGLYEGDWKQSFYEGLFNGKAVAEGSFASLDYAKDCLSPIEIKRLSVDKVHLTWKVRCRKCGPCRRAKVAYWALAAVEQTRLAAEQGRRTWFGTLTLRREAVSVVQDRAFEQWAQAQDRASSAPPDWLSDPKCDVRFALMREQLVRECQLYWKRLRKAGHKFKYLLVFERHKSGEPHMHWLLHEEGEPILKRHLQAQWPHGFTNVKLVGGDSMSEHSAERAAWYVAKYLGKTVQARQIASRLYRPSRKQDVH